MRRGLTPAPWEERDHRLMRGLFMTLGFAMFVFAILCALGFVMPMG